MLKTLIISTIIVTSTFAVPPPKSLHKPKKVETKATQKVAQPPQRAREGLENMICNVFGKDCAMAIAIAKAESGLRCDAVSPTNDHGAFQLNIVHMPKLQGRSPYDCQANIEVAYQIYKVQGWSPWSVYTNESYLKFL